MAYLLDTNVISETVKKAPEQKVLAWLEAQKPTDLFLAAQTIGELLRGAWKTLDTGRREQFRTWIENDLVRQFEGRVLPFDRDIARIWGRLMGEGDRGGRTPPAADAQIAAIAIHYDFSLVTRNIKDFDRLGVSLINPWNAGG